MCTNKIMNIFFFFGIIILVLMIISKFSNINDTIGIKKEKLMSNPLFMAGVGAFLGICIIPITVALLLFFYIFF